MALPRHGRGKTGTFGGLLQRDELKLRDSKLMLRSVEITGLVRHRDRQGSNRLTVASWRYRVRMFEPIGLQEHLDWLGKQVLTPGPNATAGASRPVHRAGRINLGTSRPDRPCLHGRSASRWVLAEDSAPLTVDNPPRTG